MTIALLGTSMVTLNTSICQDFSGKQKAARPLV
jgi:hypothetical protein